MSDAGRAMVVRSQVEGLAVQCLTFAWTRAVYLNGGTDFTGISVGHVAVAATEIATMIRMEVGRRLPEILASDQADEVVERMARQIAREKT